MSAARRVVRRIRQHEFGFVPIQKVAIGSGLPGVTTHQDVLAEMPDVARLGSRCAGREGRDVINSDRIAGWLEKKVEFTNLEAGDLVKIEVSELLQLNGQQLLVPFGILGQAVVGEDVPALFRIGQALDRQGWDLVHVGGPSGLDAGVTSNYMITTVDQYRRHEAEPLDRS
jgi:hypothetical protein